MRILAFCIVLFGTNLVASDCPNNGTYVTFGNGVRTLWPDALLDLEHLKKLHTIAELDKNPTVGYMVAYANYGTSFQIDDETVFGSLMDALEVVVQKRGESARSFWRWLGDIESAPEWFKEKAKGFIRHLASQESLTVPDLQNHISQYDKLLKAGFRIIIVSHSQGNFLANAAFDALPENRKTSVGIVSIATPANRVGSEEHTGRHYFIFEDDIITWVPANLPANLPPTGFSNSIKAHSFRDAYLALARNEIRNAMKSVADQLDYPCKTDPDPYPDPNSSCDEGERLVIFQEYKSLPMEEGKRYYCLDPLAMDGELFSADPIMEIFDVNTLYAGSTRSRYEWTLQEKPKFFGVFVKFGASLYGLNSGGGGGTGPEGYHRWQDDWWGYYENGRSDFTCTLIAITEDGKYKWVDFKVQIPR